MKFETVFLVLAMFLFAVPIQAFPPGRKYHSLPNLTCRLFFAAERFCVVSFCFFLSIKRFRAVSGNVLSLLVEYIKMFDSIPFLRYKKMSKTHDFCKTFPITMLLLLLSFDISIKKFFFELVY